MSALRREIRVNHDSRRHRHSRVVLGRAGDDVPQPATGECAIMIHLLNANALHIPLAANTVQCVITSPPYWGLRCYGVDAQLGLEATPDEFLANMVSVFREVWRVLKDTGVLFVNMGDSYGDGKQLQGMPWRLAFALQSDGWILRSDIIWHKPNPMPESVTDRPTKAHEYVFLLSKQGRYFYDADAVRENHVRLWNPLAKNGSFTGGGIPRAEKADGRIPNPKGRNRRTVWTVATQPYSGSHFATFPTALIEPMILAGSRPGDLVLDPFSGTATVGEVSRKHHRRYVGLELNPEYIELAKERTRHIQPTLFDFNSVMA